MFSYAHKDTQKGERETATAVFNRPNISSEIKKIRERAFAREIPVSDDETLNFLCTVIRATKPKNILELGTAVGVSGAAMLDCCENARLITVERDENFYNEARANFKELGIDNRVNAVLGDAGGIIEELDEEFDFIFLDCAKVQYIKYLPRLKRLLKKGGTLFADDVLLFGYVTGETPVPPKRKMLASHVREYIDAVICDEELQTSILNVGNGVALSVKL